jgi:excisionase family DNA binding protein
MINKQAAADYLGVSSRAVERYTQQGKLSVQYEPGKTRPVAIYDEQELKALKTELDRELYARRPIVTREPNSDNPDQALARLSENSNSEAMSLLIPILKAVGIGNNKLSIPIADKLILDLKEAQALTHFSRADLLEAIKSKKLKASMRGRGWKIKRSELEKYVQNLI